MEEIELYNIAKAIEKYNNEYNDINNNNAIKAIENFDESWKIIVPYSMDETCDNESKYGLALITYSIAIHKQSNLSENHVLKLNDLINNFAKEENAKNQNGICKNLFYNLGLCWHKLGNLYDSKSIEAFKKFIFYSLKIEKTKIGYYPTSFAFKKCTTFLYQSLINDQLNLSSPSTFNDPFDSPIMTLLSLGNEISSLINQAIQNCLKIACFSCNNKDPSSAILYDKSFKINVGEKKHPQDKDIYLNELMWAHYADYHRGICIKYQFGPCQPNHINNSPYIVSFFKDVIYSDKKLEYYSTNKEMPVHEAFLLKSSAWNYENELRYLSFNLNGKGDYETVDIPHCIEAIYFGLKCSESDKKTIQNIMTNKEFIRKTWSGAIIEKKPVEFYQMEIDQDHFGQIKPIKLK